MWSVRRPGDKLIATFMVIWLDKMLFLVKCFDNKIVKLPGFTYAANQPRIKKVIFKLYG